jgi:hypothetical protein
MDEKLTEDNMSFCPERRVLVKKEASISIIAAMPRTFFAG